MAESQKSEVGRETIVADRDQPQMLLDVEPSAPIARVAQVVRLDAEQPTGRTQQIDRVIVRHSEQVDQLFAALAEAQAEEGYGDIEKTQTARVDSKRTGIAYTYDYETLKDVLDATRPFLGRHGIAILQFPFPGASSITIRTELGHKSGQWIYNDLTASLVSLAPQDVGSGISFLRRYALKSITGVAAASDDDDGGMASGAAQTSSPRPATRLSQQPSSATAPTARSDKPSAEKPPANIGRIRSLAERGGGMLVELDTGLVASTRSDEIARTLHGLKTAEALVELSVRPSTNPAKFAPVIEEVHRRVDAAGDAAQ